MPARILRWKSPARRLTLSDLYLTIVAGLTLLCFLNVTLQLLAAALGLALPLH